MQLKCPRWTPWIGRARNGFRQDRGPARDLRATDEAELQRTEQWRRIEHDRQPFPDPAADARVVLVAGSAHALIPGPPHLPVPHRVVPIPGAAMLLLADAGAGTPEANRLHLL